MRIGIDIDGVLADTLTKIIEYHNSEYGTGLTRNQFHSYGYWKIWGGTKGEAIQILHDFYKAPHFTNIQPVVGAKKAISNLSKNNDLYIITSRPSSITNATLDWLNKHFPNTFTDVCFGNHYSLNGDSITKEQICNDLDVDILIEDSVEHALECVVPKRRVFLLDSPWNQRSELPQGIERYHSWPEIVAAI